MKYDIEELFPCHSVIIGLSGRIGGHVFYMRGKNICARAHVVPSNPRTARQQEGRARFALAVKRWRALDGGARAELNRRARKAKRTGYNLFISEYLRKSGEAPEAVCAPDVPGHALAKPEPRRPPAGAHISPPFQYVDSSMITPIHLASRRATRLRSPKGLQQPLLIAACRSRAPDARAGPLDTPCGLLGDRRELFSRLAPRSGRPFSTRIGLCTPHAA